MSWSFNEAVDSPFLVPEMEQPQAVPSGGKEVRLLNPKGDYPFRGNQVPILREGDPNAPVVVPEAHVRIFDTSIPEDLEAYTAIQNQFAIGLCQTSKEDILWIPETKSWKIFLRWAQFWSETPQYTKSRMGTAAGVRL